MEKEKQIKEDNKTPMERLLNSSQRIIDTTKEVPTPPKDESSTMNAAFWILYDSNCATDDMIAKIHELNGILGSFIPMNAYVVEAPCCKYKDLKKIPGVVWCSVIKEEDKIDWPLIKHQLESYDQYSTIEFSVSLIPSYGNSYDELQRKENIALDWQEKANDQNVVLNLLNLTTDTFFFLDYRTIRNRCS